MPFHRFIVMSVLCSVLLASCSVRTSSSTDGKQKNVDIRSPFGSIKVHEGASEAEDVGLPSYPGAQPMKSDGNYDHNNADINIASSLFRLKVVVQKFETDDSPDQVLSFYQKPMGKYGNVIHCSGSFGGYRPHHKDGPVSCDEAGGTGERELKVGSERNQHLVAVKPHGKGSEFALVYLRTDERSGTI